MSRSVLFRSIGHPEAKQLVLTNIAAIVRQAPFQCEPCQVGVVHTIMHTERNNATVAA